MTRDARPARHRRWQQQDRPRAARSSDGEVRSSRRAGPFHPHLSEPRPQWPPCASAVDTVAVATRGRPAAARGERLHGQRRPARGARRDRGRVLPAAAGASTSPSRTTPFAMLRTGTDRGFGVAVVCGAGINCVGISPGRTASCASRRSDASRATGAAGSAWPRSRCGGRCGPRTDVVRLPRSSPGIAAPLQRPDRRPTSPACSTSGRWTRCRLNEIVPLLVRPGRRRRRDRREDRAAAGRRDRCPRDDDPRPPRPRSRPTPTSCSAAASSPPTTRCSWSRSGGPARGRTAGNGCCSAARPARRRGRAARARAGLGTTSRPGPRATREALERARSGSADARTAGCPPTAATTAARSSQ